MSAPQQARPRRLGLYLPFILLLLLAVGWTGLWLYGRHRVGQGLDEFFARQASIGRIWSCPDRRIGGYPFRIDLSCEKPSFVSSRDAREEIAGTLTRLTVTAQTAGALDLAHVIATFEGPLNVTENGRPALTASWRQANASYRGHHRRLERLSLTIAEPVVTLESPGQPAVRLSAQSAEAHVREGLGAQGPNAYDIAIKLNQAAIPPLDEALRTTEPVNLLLDGKVLNMGAFDRRDWRATIENWRNAGGTFRVEQFRLAKGAPRIDAKGDIKLDVMRRLEGRLDADFVNAGPLLQQFGINIGGGGAAGLIGGLLGGVPRAGEPARDRSLRLPLILGDGRLAVGPFRVPGVILRPLY